MVTSSRKRRAKPLKSIRRKKSRRKQKRTFRISPLSNKCMLEQNKIFAEKCQDSNFLSRQNFHNREDCLNRVGSSKVYGLAFQHCANKVFPRYQYLYRKGPTRTTLEGVEFKMLSKHLEQFKFNMNSKKRKSSKSRKRRRRVSRKQKKFN